MIKNYLPFVKIDAQAAKKKGQQKKEPKATKSSSKSQ